MIFNLIFSNSQSAWDYQQANIICPLYDQQVPRTLTEQYVIYNVTKEEYDECSLRSLEAAKIVALCNTPYKPKFYTLTFRSFSPTPGAFEFHPGNLYFFIATNYLETANGHQQRKISRPKCSHPPMRLVFRIHEENKDDDKRKEIQPRELPIIDNIIDDAGISSSSSSLSISIYIFLLVILN